MVPCLDLKIEFKLNFAIIYRRDNESFIQTELKISHFDWRVCNAQFF